jgi:hypothetical protein
MPSNRRRRPRRPTGDEDDDELISSLGSMDSVSYAADLRAVAPKPSERSVGAVVASVAGPSKAHRTEPGRAHDEQKAAVADGAIVVVDVIADDDEMAEANAACRDDCYVALTCQPRDSSSSGGAAVQDDTPNLLLDTDDSGAKPAPALATSARGSGVEDNGDAAVAIPGTQQYAESVRRALHFTTQPSPAPREAAKVAVARASVTSTSTVATERRQSSSRSVVKSALPPLAPRNSPVTPPSALAQTVNHPRFAVSIADCGLPESLVVAYAARGITELFPWQTCCLQDYYRSEARNAASAADAAAPVGHHVSGNLVYTAPTSGGKTLVSEVIMMRAVLGLDEPTAAGEAAVRRAMNSYAAAGSASVSLPRRKALFVVPYVAIAEEKADYFTAVTATTPGIRVACHAGSKGQRMLAGDILVCTTEKANVLVNLFLESGRGDELAIVVVDELHQIAEPGRGHVLELLITKLLHLRASRKAAAAAAKSFAAGAGPPASPLPPPPLRLVGMSATLTQPRTVSTWFDSAFLFMTDYRPVPLLEHYVIADAVFDRFGVELRQLPILQRSALMNNTTTTTTHNGATATILEGPSDSTATVLPQPTFELVLKVALQRFLSPNARLGLDGPFLCLVAESLRDGFQTLVFCATREQCAATCRMLADFVRYEVPHSAVFPSNQTSSSFRRPRETAADLMLRNKQQTSGVLLTTGALTATNASSTLEHASISGEPRHAARTTLQPDRVHHATAQRRRRWKRRSAPSS